jgi:hypothetical protein
MIACQLINAPSNTIASFFPNTGGQYDNVSIDQWISGKYSSDFGDSSGLSGGTNGWAQNGTNVLAPGNATWFYNPNTTNMGVTFVGTVPSGSLTNTLTATWNMVSSILPLTGDIITNMSLTNFNNGDSGQYSDSVFVWNAGAHPQTYSSYNVQGNLFGGQGYQQEWIPPGDPVMTNVGSGFWYYNTGPNIVWVENYSVSQ